GGDLAVHDDLERLPAAAGLVGRQRDQTAHAGTPGVPGDIPEPARGAVRGAGARVGPDRAGLRDRATLAGQRPVGGDQMSLVGVGLGTSGIRAAAVDTAGRPLASVGRRTGLRHGPPGIVETDAEECLRVVTSLLAELTNHEAVIADPVEAVSFSVQGEAVLPVDADGYALAPAPVSMDRRRSEERRVGKEWRSRWAASPQDQQRVT